MTAPVCGELAEAVMLKDPLEKGVKIVDAVPDGPVMPIEGVRIPPTEDQETFSPRKGSPRNLPVRVKLVDSFEYMTDFGVVMFQTRGNAATWKLTCEESRPCEEAVSVADPAPTTGNETDT